MALIEANLRKESPALLLTESGSRVSVTETWWGYLIRSERVISAERRLVSLIAGFLAICFAVAGAALWIAPAAAFSGEVVLMKGAGSSLMAIIALLLSRLANEDPVVEIHVDCHRAELREYVRRSGNRPLLLGRYTFEEIGGVFQDRSGAGRLVARYRNTSHLITIAEGQGPALDRIRDRMGRDIMGAPLSV